MLSALHFSAVSSTVAPAPLSLSCGVAGADCGCSERAHDRWGPGQCLHCMLDVHESAAAPVLPRFFACPRPAGAHHVHFTTETVITCCPLPISLQLPVYSLSHSVVPWPAEDWHSAIIFGLSVAAALSPQMMPMMLTANLARGTAQMRKNQAVVRRLDAVQNMGAM